MKDSQYNLAMLYAKGYGVTKNPADAYKWYLIASAGGDEGAKTAAQAIRPQLTPEAQTAAEHAAASLPHPNARPAAHRIRRPIGALADRRRAATAASAEA